MKTPGLLTLYTLRGDNWPDPKSKPGIKKFAVARYRVRLFYSGGAHW